MFIRTLGTNFIEILSNIYTFSFKKMHLSMPSGKWQPFFLGLNVLSHYLNQCCYNGKWTCRNKFKWNSNQDTRILFLRQCFWQCHLQTVHHFVQALCWYVCFCVNLYWRQHWPIKLWWNVTLAIVATSGGRLNKKDGLTRYGNSHVKDKTS